MAGVNGKLTTRLLDNVFKKTMNMKSIYTIIAYSLLILFITSCGENLYDTEQYKKEVYLIGGYNRVLTVDVMYSREAVESHFTISSSGSVALDKNVEVSLAINNDLVDSYNKKYWGIMNLDRYYKPLGEAFYTIPSLAHNTIQHENGISVNVPFFVQTEHLEADTSYVIPVEIESVTGYPVSESGRKMLILLNLQNMYSGNYKMDGHMTEVGKGPRRIQKAKVVTATGVDDVRIFYAMNNESGEKDDILNKTIKISVLDECIAGSDNIKKVVIKTWNEDKLIVIDSGKGTYNPDSKSFYLEYMIGGTEYRETLTKEKEIL